MSFHARHLGGESSSPAHARWADELLDELAAATDEHPDVAAVHESGWSLSVFASGLIIWENVEEDSVPRHGRGLERASIVELLHALARGDIDTIERTDWRPGYG